MRLFHRLVFPGKDLQVKCENVIINSNKTPVAGLNYVEFGFHIDCFEEKSSGFQIK